MRCLTDDDVAAFAEGTLDAGALDAIDAHLATCARCCALVGIARAEDHGSEGDRGDTASGRARVGHRPSLGRGESLGRYVVIESLGKGGMGEVYRARDTKLSREVALKIVAADSGAADRSIDRLVREARAVAALNHPNVVQIFEAELVGETAYIAMELVVGKTLRDEIRHGHASIATRVTWLDALADALDHAHARGIIHRDIKPENVMLRDDGSLAVLDFGLARRPEGALVVTDAPRLTTLTKRGTLVGTPAYMAPEQLLGEAVDARTDQFAWGVVAYELLAGKRPWEKGGRQGLADLVDCMMNDPPAPLPDAIAEPLRKAIVRALCVRPQGRFESMRAVRDAIDVRQGAATRRLIPSEEPRVVRTSRWTRAIAIGALSCAAIAAFEARHTFDETARSSTSSAPSLEKIGPSISTNAEALGEYRLGLQAARDAASANPHFERAAELDPWFAAAHLRCVVNLPPADRDAIVSHFQAARRMRSALDEHDRLLLDAYEPLSHDVADAREAVHRMEALVHSHPGDADFLVSLCRLRFFAGSYARAAEACTDAAHADGQLAIAYWWKGLSLVFADDVTAARQAYDDCLRVSPAGTLCINDRINLEMNEGLCKEAIGDARQFIALEPSSPFGYLLLANSLAGDGALEAATTALAQRWPRLEARERSIGEAQDRGDIAIMTGDEKTAESWFRAREAALVSVRGEGDHLALFRERAMFALEKADDVKASTLADLFLTDRLAGWSAAQGIDNSIVAWGVRYRAGTMSKAELGRRRARWLEIERAKPTFGQLGSGPGMLWVIAYAEPTKTQEDAIEALRELPAYAPLPDAYTRSPDIDEPIGRVYLRAHAIPEALRYLGRAAHACSPIYFPLFQIEASLELAEARSASGDAAGACEAYATVLERWGKMRGSRSAARARAESRRLGCGR